MREHPPHPGWWKATDGKWYPPLPPSNGHAVGAALIGAAAAFASILSQMRELALIAGVVAVITGFYARIIPVQRGLATTGIALGAVASLISLTWYAWLASS